MWSIEDAEFVMSSREAHSDRGACLAIFPENPISPSLYRSLSDKRLITSAS